MKAKDIFLNHIDMTNYLQQIKEYFKNLVLNSAGVERSLLELLQDSDVSTAIGLMRDRDKEVNDAIKEYNPQTHEIMHRPNKYRKSGDYISEKLPRRRQVYINEVELFFLLGKPVKWMKKDGSDKSYGMFLDFLKNQRFDSNMRKAKRLAGAETESAKLYHVFRNERYNEINIKTVVLARQTGYRLRPLFDQYGNLTAFAYGYKLKENGRVVEHWDIQTPDILFYCKKGKLGWEVESFQNPTGKINIIYYNQLKAWDGAEPRLNREEILDSKVADTNNYFADPIAAASADVIDSMCDPDKPGKLIQLTGASSKFEYVNPPQNSEARAAEKQDLHDSILFDTFTPDFSFDKIKGMGTLSGDAIKNAMILGFIKRDNLKEIYEEFVDREKNIILALLKYIHPDMAEEFDSLDISFEFSDPFTQDKEKTWASISNLYSNGLVSLEQAVEMLALTDAPEDEVERIRKGNVQSGKDESSKTEKQDNL